MYVLLLHLVLVEVNVLVLGKSVWSLLWIFNELIICLGKKEQIKITATSLEVSQNETVQNDIFLRVCISTTKKYALPQWLTEGYSKFFFNNKYFYLFTNGKGNFISSIYKPEGWLRVSFCPYTDLHPFQLNAAISSWVSASSCVK